MRSKSKGLLFIISVLGVAGMSLGASKSSTTRPAHAGRKKKMAATSQPADSVYAFSVKDIDDKEKSLADYKAKSPDEKGKVLLIVNVASKCGFTKQYTGLEAIYEKYKDRGLVLIGFPSNDFHQQEPGTPSEIKTFCSTKYHVTFPLMAKSSVKKGPEQNPLYQYLTDKSQNGVYGGDITWNFNKFLIDRNGKVIKHYESKVTPESEELTADIEKALKD